MDMLGHLNQSVYHELLEEARAGLFSELVRRVGERHTYGAYVVVHVELDYHAEVRKDHGAVDILVHVSNVGTSSIELSHDISRPDGTLAASGRTVLVAWDPAIRGKRPLSEYELAALR
jgi:acyl-CoA thioester hydrolase